MPEDELAIRKATLRRLVLARRGALAQADRDDAGGRVAAAVMAAETVADADAVLGFASFGTELPTDPTMQAILDAGKRLLLPFVDGTSLRAAEVASVEDLAPGYRGIREPAERTAIDPAIAAVVLVPGVAFDARGRRLGYGGGFYDGLLAGLPDSMRRIGLCFDLQLVDEVPAGSRDEPVHAVITERRAVDCDPA